MNYRPTFTDTITQSIMVNTGNTLHLAFKLYAGRVGAGGSFQVFCGAQLCKHLTFDAAFFAACCYPARFITAAIWIALHPDILLLCPAQFLRQLAHHAASRGWFQIRQQGTQPAVHLLQFSHVSPSTFLQVHRVLLQLQRSTHCRQY